MEKIKLDVVDLGSNGEGIAKNDGKVYFIPYALPSETIIANIVKNKKSFCECELEEIISASKNRCEAKCKHFGKCGGCVLQNLEKEKTIEYKTNLIKNAFYKYAGISVNIDRFESRNQYGYRNKMVFYIKKTDSYHLCMMKNSSNEKVEIDECLIAKTEIKNIMKNVENYLNDCYKSIEKQKLTVFAIMLRSIKNVFDIVFVVNKKMQFDAKKVEKHLNNCNIYENISKNGKTLNGQINCIKKVNNEIKDYLGLKITVSPKSFFQVNDEICEVLYKDIMNCVEGKVVANAYSGAGVLSALFAKTAQKVVAIEIEKSAHIDAEKLKIENNVLNLTNLCGDCEKLLPEVVKSENITSLVIDPPRSGVGENLCTILNDSGIDEIVYVSCYPATLARDCKILSNYKIVKMYAYDMFPQTANVETLVYLKRY